MRAIPDSFWDELDTLLESGVMTLAVTVELLNNQAFYLTPSNVALEKNSQTYQPFPLRLGRIEDSGQGDLPTTSLVMSNVGRFPMPYLENGTWDQARVIVEFVYLPDVSLDLQLRFDAHVQSATAKDDVVELALGQPNWFDRLYPGERWVRSINGPGIPRNAN